MYHYSKNIHAICSSIVLYESAASIVLLLHGEVVHAAAIADVDGVGLSVVVGRIVLTSAGLA